MADASQGVNPGAAHASVLLAPGAAAAGTFMEGEAS
jgi:hypothetical protein